MNQVNKIWGDLVHKILSEGKETHRRGFECIEILSNTTKIPMSKPLMTIKSRNLNYNFAFGEAWWMCSGRNDVPSIASTMKAIAKFSDNNVVFNGAYGPMIVDQISYIIDSFKNDINTRQAVMSIWRPNPRDTKDFPCTLIMHFMYDEHENKFNSFVDMRSSDVNLGWCYDIFNFSMVALYMMHILKYSEVLPEHVGLGDLYLNAHNQHIYKNQLDSVNNSLLDLNTVYDYPETFQALADDPTGNKFNEKIIPDLVKYEGLLYAPDKSKHRNLLLYLHYAAKHSYRLMNKD